MLQKAVDRDDTASRAATRSQNPLTVYHLNIIIDFSVFY